MEAFNAPILCRSAGSDEIQANISLSCPVIELDANELGAIVTGDHFWITSRLVCALLQTFYDTLRWQTSVNHLPHDLSTGDIDDVEYPKLAPTRGFIGDEVHSPAAVVAQSWWRKNTQMIPALLEFAVLQAKLFLLVDLVHRVLPHPYAFVPQQHAQPSAAIPGPRPCNLKERHSNMLQ